MTTLAEKIADALMTGGNGKADRLVLENSVGNLGGRCRQSVVNCIDEVLAEQPASERVCRWTRVTHSAMYYGEYKTDCGQIFEGNELGRVGSGYLHCPKCTGRVVEGGE